jgi:hypothetical protein
MLQFTTSSFLWLLACFALGAGYAFLLYGRPGAFNPALRKAFFALRVLAVALLAFLLFAPLLKIASQVSEKPLIIVAQDNSASIGVAEPKGFDEKKYQDDLNKAIGELKSDYDVRVFHFSGSLEKGLDFRNTGKLTDLSSVFSAINDQFSNRNIGAILFATDGIYNRGGNPKYEAVKIKAPVYSIALGDTIPRRDLLISNVNFNNIVYLDNQYQVEVSVEAFQCKGASSVLTVSDRNGTLFTKTIQIPENEFRTTIPVTLLAAKVGIQALTIRLSPLKNELSLRNNQQSVFIDVLDGREKVLVVANAPHPDLSALKQSIETNKNYEVTIRLIGDVQPPDVQDAGLVILHQLPSATNNAATLLRMAANKSLLFIVGAQTNLAGFSNAQNALRISPSGTTQEVIAHLKPDFYSFTLSDATKGKLAGFAPLVAPFGTYSLKGPASVLLSQQIGKVVTESPLLLFADEPQRKVGVLAGEGLWRWRLDDYNESSNHDATDELINKMIQYLSAKDDKRKFRVFPSRRSFDENDRVILNGELYNDAYELVNTPDVNVVLKNGNGNSYNFLFSKTANAYELDAGNLPPGDYVFQASVRLGTRSYTSSGQFIISQEQAEFQHTTANHQLLYDLAAQSNGARVYPGQVEQLPKLIKANEQVKTVTYENRRYEDLINLKALFFAILTFLTIEWFCRKRSGEV